MVCRGTCGTGNIVGSSGVVVVLSVAASIRGNRIIGGHLASCHRVDGHHGDKIAFTTIGYIRPIVTGHTRCD